MPFLVFGYSLLVDLSGPGSPVVDHPYFPCLGSFFVGVAPPDVVPSEVGLGRFYSSSFCAAFDYSAGGYTVTGSSLVFLMTFSFFFNGFDSRALLSNFSSLFTVLALRMWT